MTPKLLLTTSSSIGFAFGLGLVVAPDFLLGQYGLSTNGAGVALARLLGAELIGFNIATFLARRDPEGEGARLAVLGHAVSEPIGALATLAALLTGVGNPMLWSVFALYALFSAAYGYFQFRARGGASAPS